MRGFSGFTVNIEQILRIMVAFSYADRRRYSQTTELSDTYVFRGAKMWKRTKIKGGGGGLTVVISVYVSLQWIPFVARTCVCFPFRCVAFYHFCNIVELVIVFPSMPLPLLHVYYKSICSYSSIQKSRYRCKTSDTVTAGIIPTTTGMTSRFSFLSERRVLSEASCQKYTSLHRRCPSLAAKRQLSFKVS